MHDAPHGDVPVVASPEPGQAAEVFQETFRHVPFGNGLPAHEPEDGAQILSGFALHSSRVLNVQESVQLLVAGVPLVPSVIQQAPPV